MHYYHTVLRGSITKQVVFWRAKRAHMMCHLWCWVEEHAQTLELGYQAAATHATHEYTTQRLNEWHRRVRHTAEVFWECKRDIFEFWANRLNL